MVLVHKDYTFQNLELYIYYSTIYDKILFPLKLLNQKTNKKPESLTSPEDSKLLTKSKYSGLIS